jgi:hypothetical protein
VRAVRRLVSLSAGVALLAAPSAFAALALLIPAVASGSAPAQLNKLCAVPHRWRLVVRDRYAAVIRRRGGAEYCSLVARAGTFKALPRVVGAGPVGAIQLKGRYIGFDQCVSGCSALILDTETGRHAAIRAPVVRFAVSRSGVLAEIADGYGHGGIGSILAVVTIGNAGETLDTAWPDPTALANLQLYDCAAACAPNTVVVAWTDNGQQRYAQASG